MKASIGIVKAVIVVIMALMGAQAQADIIKHVVRLGAFQLSSSNSHLPLTASGASVVTFTGSGKFTIWYSAECVLAGRYVNVDIHVDGIPLGPTGANGQDSYCDGNTGGAMHTVTGRTHSLTAGTHSVEIIAHTDFGAVAFLSDSSLLIGK